MKISRILNILHLKYKGMNNQGKRIIPLLMTISFLFNMSYIGISQSLDQEILLRYWYYRDRLKYFVVPGSEKGESQIAGIRNRWDGDISWSNSIDYGQHGVYFGYYLGVLATEYRLLINNNQIENASETQIDVNLALLQYINYLDICEEYHYGYPNLFDGFFIRYDVEASFFNDPENHALNQGLKESDNWNNTSFSNFPAGHPGYISWRNSETPYPEPMSQDEAIGVLLGLALIHECMDGTPQQSLAADLANKIVTYISNDDTWEFYKPDGSSNGMGGNNSLLYSYGFARAAEYFGYDVCDYFICNTFPPYSHVLAAKLVWNNIIQGIAWGPGNVSEASMEATLAAIGDSWEDGLGVNTTVPIINAKCDPFSWNCFYLLLHKVFHPEKSFSCTDYISDAKGFMGDAPFEGPYFYYYGNSGEGWWSSSYRWHKNEEQQQYGYWISYENPAFYGNYNGLDYMLLYNLVQLVEGNANTDYHPYQNLSLSGSWPKLNHETIIGDVPNSAKLIALNSLESDATIYSENANNPSSYPGDVTLLAENTIKLKDGFQAEKGSFFQASIKNHIFGDDFSYNSEGLGSDVTTFNLSDAFKTQVTLADYLTESVNKPTSGFIFQETNPTLMAIFHYTIHPNPTNERVFVSFFNTNGMKIVTKVFNATGYVINQTETSSDNIIIDLSGYPTGVYIFQIITPEEQYLSKVIKN